MDEKNCIYMFLINRTSIKIMDESPIGFAITVFFTEQAIFAMIGIEAPSFIYIHNQRKKKKMGKHKFPHCCTTKNITMARSFAPLLAYTHNQKKKRKKKGS